MIGVEEIDVARGRKRDSHCPLFAKGSHVPGILGRVPTQSDTGGAVRRAINIHRNAWEILRTQREWGILSRVKD